MFGFNLKGFSATAKLAAKAASLFAGGQLAIQTTLYELIMNVSSEHLPENQLFKEFGWYEFTKENIAEFAEIVGQNIEMPVGV